MSKHYDKSNPSDVGGLVGTGLSTYGIVVDVNDPKKLGRVKIRRFDQDKSRVPDDKLPWVRCGYNNMPSQFGMGSSPPNYQVGSKVLMFSEGQQGYIVMMSVPNAETDEQRQDIHEDAKDPKHRDTGAGTNNQDVFKRYTEDLRTTDEALNNLNQEKPTWQKEEKDHKPGVDQAPTPPHYNKRPAAKDKEGEFPTVATSLFQKPRNPQDFIKGIVGDQSSVVKKSLDMLENLKQAAMNPHGAPMPTQAIGAQNIASALQGLFDLFQEQDILDDVKPDTEDDEIIANLYEFEDSDTITAEADVT